MSTAANGNELLVVEDLKKHFPITRGIVFQKEIATVKAVDGVSFSLREGETLGIVGESGCGKSTLVRCILKLLEPSGGRILFQGQDITGLSRRDMRPLRRNMMMVFQDPVRVAQRAQARRASSSARRSSSTGSGRRRSASGASRSSSRWWA